MNKAFVKEDSESSDDVLLETDEIEAALDQELFKSAVSGAPKNYMTRNGFERLQNELYYLLEKSRPQFAAIVSGPGSHNAESHDFQIAKAQLEQLDRRIRTLQRRLDIAEVIDPETQSSDQVLFGATVTARDEADQLRVYRIVGVDETDIKAGKVSWVSPIGRALLQAQVGDSVTLKMPQGEEELEILKIQYLPIP